MDSQEKLLIIKGSRFHWLEIPDGEMVIDHILSLYIEFLKAIFSNSVSV